jgi:hypothetical protein
MKRSEAKYFLFVYAAMALYFSKKMNFLVLLLAPASVLAGIAISGIFTWTLVQVWELVESVLSSLKRLKKVSIKTIAKSPHMARIGASVFEVVKVNEFYIDCQERYSRMMPESLLYNIVLNRFDQSVPPISPD